MKPRIPASPRDSRTVSEICTLQAPPCQMRDGGFAPDSARRELRILVASFASCACSNASFVESPVPCVPSTTHNSRLTTHDSPLGFRPGSSGPFTVNRKKLNFPRESSNKVRKRDLAETTDVLTPSHLLALLASRGPRGQDFNRQAQNGYVIPAIGVPNKSWNTRNGVFKLLAAGF
jgi:hypothetical protein